MAHVQETTIEAVVNSGPGLVFLTYPDLVLKLPWSVLWSFIFFCMLLVSIIILRRIVPLRRNMKLFFDSRSSALILNFVMWKP